jgi:tetratricopeptide (TPR) repeat protein
MSNTAAELIQLGNKARKDRQLEDARRFFSESVGLCRASSDPLALASSLTGLGQIERDLNNNSAALRHYQEAIELLRRGADPLRLAHAVRHMADILRHEHSFEQARICYEEALAIYRRHSDASALDVANAVRGFALLQGDAGQNDAAMSLWQEARSLYESVNVQAGVQESDIHISRLTRD